MQGNIYFKSLSREIKRKPLQPIIILVVLILSTIVLNVSFSLSGAFTQNESNKVSITNGSSEILIKTNSHSKSRFIIEDDILELIPNATVTGVFTVPFLLNEKLQTGCAVDFKSVNTIFSFSFIEYESFNIVDKSNVVFIYDSYAKKNNISCGDKITLTMFGKTNEYKVKGISKTPFMNDTYIMCDISSVINTLMDSSSFVSMFTNDFTIYNAVYIKTVDGNVDSAISILTDKYSDYSITRTNVRTKLSIEGIARGISITMLFICIVTTFAVILTSLYCLSKQRAEIAFLFSVVGYTQKKLKFYRCAEMAFYAIISYIIGVFLSIIVGNLSYSLIGFEYVEFSLKPLNVFLSLLFILILAIVSPLLQQKGNRKKIKFNFKYVKIICLVLTIVFSIIVVFIKIKYKFTFSLIAIAFLFICIALYTKDILKFVSKFFVKRTKNIITQIAYKNVAQINEISNIAKLVAIMVAVLMMACSFLFSSWGVIYVSSNWFIGDYAITSVNSSSVGKIQEIGEIDSISSVYFSNDFSYNGKEIFVMGLSDFACINKYSYIDALPNGNEIVSSKTYAGKYGIEEGDTIELLHNGKYYEFVVKKLYDSNDFTILLDNEYVNEEFNYYIVTAKAGVAKEQLFNKLSSTLSTDMVTIMPVGEVMGYLAERQMVYIYFIMLTIIILFIFGVIGVYNNISESNRARSMEFEYYNVSGMSLKDVKRLRKRELLISCVFTIVYSFIVGIVLVMLSNLALFSFGSDCFVLMYSVLN